MVNFTNVNPYFTVSWEEWKPARYYNYIAAHMDSIFGAAGSKTKEQCKTKDQQLKVKYFNKAENPVDLLEFAIRNI